MEIISQSIKTILLRAIIGYQKVVKPWTTPCCRYQPTCSEYAKLCLQNKKLLPATAHILKRLLRCNPFSQGGLDYPSSVKDKERRGL